MDEAERFEALLLVLDELAEANEAVPIVVEGQRDVASLRLLACRGAIVPLNRGEPLFTFCERLAGTVRGVILLTDWDRKGAQLFDSLSAGLAACGVRVDGTYRDNLRRWMYPPVQDVESLAGYVARGLARHQGSTLEERAAKRA